MLDENIKQQIRDGLANLANLIPGYKSRPAQRYMIAEVSKTLARVSPPEDDPAILLVEAGTGCGKSAAYSLPGMIIAKQLGKKLVLSSSTIALQQQLVNRDLPLFAKAAGLDVKIELAKGRTRYVCQYKLAKISEDLQRSSRFAREDDELGQGAKESVKSMLELSGSGQWNGDRDLHPAVSDVLWSKITTDRAGCLGKNCAHYNTCAQVAARRRLRDADVLVANHDLVLADLAMGGGVILPDPKDTYFVFDEGHALTGKAVSSFSSRHVIGSDRRMCDRLGEYSAEFSDLLPNEAIKGARQVAEDSAALGEMLEDAFRYFSSLSQLQVSSSVPRPTFEFPHGITPDEFCEIGQNILKLSSSIESHLDSCYEELVSALESSSDRAKLEKLMSETGVLLSRVGNVHKTWTLFLSEHEGDEAPVAKWVESFEAKRGVDFALNASPVQAGKYLVDALWSKAAGAIVASATLSTLGTFDNYLAESGLNAYPSLKCIALPSPFNYAEQGVMEIPAMPSPKDYVAHTNAIARFIEGALHGQKADGTLVLFTSKRQMDEVAARLGPVFGDRILVQGTQSKTETIRLHSERIQKNALPSVIFGLESYGEGLDLPGALCNHVIITKLPFQVPDSPVLRTLSAWIEEKGGDAFKEVFVPAAARKLEQYVGRLIRTESDKGKVSILDPRLWNTRYGKAILHGLPSFSVIAMGKEIKR